jgi:hypothetical protein
MVRNYKEVSDIWVILLTNILLVVHVWFYNSSPESWWKIEMQKVNQEKSILRSLDVNFNYNGYLSCIFVSFNSFDIVMFT